MKARRRAVAKLCDGEAPSLKLIPYLLKVVERERDPETYRSLLVLLGKSGAMEARVPIDRHVLSPDKLLREAARQALRSWLIRNGLLAPNQLLPPPPHPIYGPPPELPPVVPAGHELKALLRTPERQWLQQPTRTPRYIPPRFGEPYAAFDDRLGVAEGFVEIERPRSKLVIAGGVVLGASYVPTAVAGVAVGSNNSAYLPLLIPVVGPWVTIITAQLFDVPCGDVGGCDGLHGAMESLYGIALIIDGVAQLTGLTLLAVGLSATKTQVVREDDERPAASQLRVSVGPGSLNMQYRF